jgi:AraC-like DNA-binding protein
MGNMEKIFDSDLKYVQEHLSCSQYQHELSNGFIYREYQAGHEIVRESSYSNFIMFVLEGSVNINCMLYPTQEAVAGTMFLIPVSSFFDIKCNVDTKVVWFMFDHWDFHCVATPFKSLKQYGRNIQSGLNIVPINRQLKLFLDLLSSYLRNGMNCKSLHKLKCDEFFLLIRGFYTKDDIVRLLHPLLANTMDFRMFCFNSVNNVKNVREMIDGSGMSRSMFYEKFKAEFGDISPKKWLDSYINQRILNASTLPGITVKELMYKTGFSDESAFTQYCKRHFGKVPSQIIGERNRIKEAL